MAFVNARTFRTKRAANGCILSLLCLFNLVTLADAIEYEVLEERVSGFLIGNIVKDAKLNDQYTQDVISSFQFDILTQGDLRQYFSLDQSTGLFRVDNTIDRDEICPQQPDCRLELDLAIVRPVDYFQIIKVQVTILDENDNAPRFTKDMITLSISEGAVPGTPGARFRLPQARDPDSGDNGISRYELIMGGNEGEDKFELEVTRNADDSFDLLLVLEEKLDREEQTQYSFQLVAYDGGSPSLSGTLGIEVLVSDYNDNAPSFEKPVYNVSILENAARMTPVVVVHAWDEDEGLNGMVRYSLAAQTKEMYGDLFVINNSTGEVSLNGQLDYETTDSYNLVVAAQDSGPDPLKDHAKVFVNVVDINDHRPSITVNALTTTGQVEILEGSSPGAFVAHISVQDLDKGRSGDVACEIEDDRYFQLEQLYETEFKLTTLESFDRETNDQYQISIVCRDNGQPPLRSSKEIMVTILDKNDHDPTFSQAMYSTSIRENNEMGQPILRVNATDADIGANANVTYTLGGVARNVFDINPKTGVISTKAVLDHEEMNEFQFIVVAKDHGDPVRSATASVKISIIDVNDEAPAFTKEHYEFGTFENQPPNTEIGTVHAHDRDGHPYKAFEFSIQPNHAATSTFAVDPLTGRITTLRILDREHTSEYLLVVIARNIEDPHPSSSVSVTIRVADKNDNAPSLRFPSKENHTAQVSIYSPEGFIFTKINANDADLGKNANKRFSIAKGNDENLFGIDPLSGAMSVERDLHDATQLKHSLLVTVTDGGDSPKSSTGVLDITINTTMVYAEENHLVAPGTTTAFELGYHQKIIIILGAVTAVLVLILVAAIIYVKRRQTLHAKEAYLYMQRVDMAHKMQSIPPHGHGHDGNPDGQSLRSDVSEKYRDHRQIPGQEMNENNANSSKNHLTLEALQRMRGPGSSSHGSNRHSLILNAPPQPSSNNPSDLEGYQLLRVIKNDRDSDSTSGCSADVSNADSGHGPSDPSEEGDPHNTSNGQVPAASQGTHPAGPQLNPNHPSLHAMPNSYPYHASQPGCHLGGRNPSLTSSKPGDTSSLSSNRDYPRNSFMANNLDNPRNSYLGSLPGSHRNSFQSDAPPPPQVPRDNQPPPVPERAPRTKPTLPQRTYPQPQNYTVRPPVGMPWSTRQSLNDSTDNVSDDGSSTSGSFVLDAGSDCLKSVDV